MGGPAGKAAEKGMAAIFNETTTAGRRNVRFLNPDKPVVISKILVIDKKKVHLPPTLPTSCSPFFSAIHALTMPLLSLFSVCFCHLPFFSLNRLSLSTYPISFLCLLPSLSPLASSSQIYTYLYPRRLSLSAHFGLSPSRPLPARCCCMYAHSQM